MKSRLINLLAYQETYFPFFLRVIVVYALVCVVLTRVVINTCLANTAMLVFLAGAAVIGVGMRVAHNWAYRQINKENNNG